MIGKVLANRYEVQKLLGRKARQKTLLVRDLHSLELFVIKLLSFNSDFEWNDLKLFEREARTLSNLSHSSIPSYIDYFEVEKPLWGFALVQTYIPAKTLEQYIKSGRTFNEAEVKQLATKLLNILVYLHSLSPPVIHRDIKPSNILLGSRSGNYLGDVFLIDFGSVQGAVVTELGTRTVVGTYGYMSLEQFGDRAVPASDIYSLGATLIYLVTGIHPADLPVRDGRIKFENLICLSDGFVEWLKALTEPILEMRIQSATQALSFLEKQKSTVISDSNSSSKSIRGAWYWDGKCWIPKGQQFLIGSLQDKFNSGAIKFTQSHGSKVRLLKDKDNLEILVLPIGFQPSLIFTGLFATGWNFLTLLWTVGAVINGSFPINLLFVFLSLPFWASGLFLIYGLIFSLFGRIRLCLNREEIFKFYELFGLKFQVSRASRAKDITKLIYIPRHSAKNSDGEQIDVFAKLIVTTGERKYKLQDGGAVNESELEWLAYELSNWLNLPISCE